MTVEAISPATVAPAQQGLGPPSRGRLADVAIPATIAIVGLLVFFPGLRAGLVSDDFYFFHLVRSISLGEALKGFEPTNQTWYRPINDFAFWIEVHVFGLNPTALHAVSLGGHLLSSILLYWLARTLGLGKTAAGVTGVLFVTSVHAHEVVWWWADAHYAFAGPLLIAAVSTWFARHRVWSTIIAAAALLTDEAAVLILPIILSGELLLVGTPNWVARGTSAVRVALPVVLLVAGYLVFRIIVGGGIWSESVPCRSAGCVVTGFTHYGVRLVLRPDVAFGIYQRHKSLVGLTLGAVVALLFYFSARGRWRHVFAFGVAWTVVATAFFVLTLWPYAADRFLYYPDMGIAIAAGALAQEVVALARFGNRGARFVAPAVATVIIVWLGTGIQMLEVRANGWIRAGQEAQTIVSNAQREVPDPPPGVVFVVDGVPDSAEPVFPPGNRGPYVFRNALQEALKLRYGRDDITVAQPGHPAAGGSPVVHLRIGADDSVQVVGDV